ncbi:hypothetical protein ILUMI_10002 [Ignelater luminosus]|uniref:Ig-like domain-containing protein n=1 Tax=Ignelater luminosus TaxID=2038154 RepID=A0A8K0GFE6_IGNLU|nr:hypothetical protein ILUMI_10002 [Ignelater luminosus]
MVATNLAIVLFLTSLHYSYTLNKILLVQSPPEIVKQPPSGEILFEVRTSEESEYEKPLILECEALGEPNPSYYWTKNGKPFIWQKEDGRILQQPGRGTLIFTKTSDEDAGQYQCFAENYLGVATSNSVFMSKFYLKSFKHAPPRYLSGAEAAPYFVVEPESVNTTEHETVEFHCKADGFPEPQITWIYNGKPLEIASPNLRRKIESNRVVIENLNKSDIGIYGCNASNLLGYVYKDVYVNLLELAPEAAELSNYVEAVYGKDIVLPCNVYGVPKPKIEWIRNSTGLNVGRYKILDSGYLHISSVLYEDTGNYNCHAENKFGNIDVSAVLTVKEPTKIVNGPENYTTIAGSSATFRCDVVLD